MLSLPNVAGLAGVGLIVLFYFLIQTGRVTADTLAYSVGNGIGAALILLSLVFDFNLPSFVFESIWLVISIFGMARVLLKRR